MTHAHKIFIRTKKEDSAFVYHILEAQEGLAAYSTLPFKRDDPHRDLELLVSPDLVPEMKLLLDQLKECVQVLSSHPSNS